MPNVEKFPRPWRVEETAAAYVVRDAFGAVVGRVQAGPQMTRAEAKDIAEKMVESVDVLAAADEVHQQKEI